MNSFARRRLFLCFSLLFFFFLVFSFRLIEIQLFRHNLFSGKAKKEYLFLERSEPLRGTIFDRNGSAIAVSKDAYSCAAWTSMVKDRNRLIKKLSPLLNLSEGELKSKLCSVQSFVWLGRKIDSQKAEKIKELEPEGVGLVRESKRFYLEGGLPWHLVGKVNIDNCGISGIELAHDDLLRGKVVKEWKSRDAKGRKIALGINQKEENRPKNISLTIDKTIQHIAERELTKVFQEKHAKKAIIVIQDVTTGEILAWASRPTYSEEEWKENPKLLNDPVLSETFEPGSTFKIVPAGFALEENLTSLDDKYFCENGLFELRGIKIRDHEKRGMLNFVQVLGYSSNIGMAKLGLKFNREKFYRFILNCGFGSPTGIGLPGESPGIVGSGASAFFPSPVSLPISCFGQGIGVTAIQLLNAYSCIANGGLLMEPQIVKEISDENGKVLWKAQPVVIRRVLSEKTTKMLQEILEGAINWGTGIKARITGYRIAGKTGTAQKYDPATGKYSESKFLSSFCGFFPLPNPRWTILVIFDESATPDYWGGSVAAPVFARVAEEIIHYFRIPLQNKETNYAQIKKSP